MKKIIGYELTPMMPVSVIVTLIERIVRPLFYICLIDYHYLHFECLVHKEIKFSIKVVSSYAFKLFWAFLDVDYDCILRVYGILYLIISSYTFYITVIVSCLGFMNVYIKIKHL